MKSHHDGLTALDAWPFEGALARVILDGDCEGYISRGGEMVYAWTSQDAN